MNDMLICNKEAKHDAHDICIQVDDTAQRPCNAWTINYTEVTNEGNYGIWMQKHENLMIC